MQRLRRLRPSPAAAALLALALLWAQALGLLHRLQHAPSTAEVAAVALADGTSDGGLYGHERKSESCKLYDQLALGDGVVAVAVTVAAVPAAEAPARGAPSAAPGTHRHDYRARAPPLTVI